MKSINIILFELMTSKERHSYIKKGMTTVKKPGAKAVTFAKHKEKKGESVTVHEHEEITDLSNAITESILLPIGNKGIFFEQDNEMMCASYVAGSQSCDIGCAKVGVDKGGRCPYQPVDVQPKCPCYARKG